MASLLLFVKEETMVQKVTPLSPKRKKGRPPKHVQLTIDAERARFRAKQKLVGLQETAVDELQKLLSATDIPPQVKLGTIKETLALCEAFYQELVVAEQEDSVEQEEITPQEQTEKTETNVIDWGEFGNLANN